MSSTALGRKRGNSRRLRLARVLALCGSSCVAPFALAGTARDATLPLEITLGGPRGFAALDAVSTRRDYCSAVPLPEQAHVAWRLRLASRATPAAAVDEQGRTLVPLDSGRLVQISAAGQVEWNVSLGGSVVAAGPVILSGGQRWVVTQNNQLFCLRADGSSCFRRVLQVPPWHVAAPPLPLANDDVIFALGRTLLHFDASGAVLAQSYTASDVRSLLRVDNRTLVVLANGHVLHWTSDARLVDNGEFPDIVRGPAALPSGSLVATVSGQRFAELLPGPGKTPSLRFAAGEPLLAGPSVAAGNLITLTTSGIVDQRAGLNGDSRRTALDAQSHPAAPPGGALLLADRAGRLAIARPNTGLVLLSSRGTATTVAEATCSNPLSLLPAGPGRVILICETGIAWMLGGEVEKTEPLETPASDASQAAQRVLGNGAPAK